MSDLGIDENNLDYGIIKAKKAFNELHLELVSTGYSQVYVDQMTADVVAVTRHNPETHQSIVLVAHTAFKHPGDHAQQGYIRPLVLDGQLSEVVLESFIVHKGHM